MRNIKHVIWLVLLFVLMVVIKPQTAVGQSGLVINEIMASNLSLERDPQFNNYSGWIEIYNGGSSTVNLNGYYLTDDLSDADKWRIGNRSVPAGGYARFWTDDEDQGNSHTNFVLRHLGEDVALFNPSQQLVDGFTFGEQVADVSFGRQTDGSATWVYFQQATPQSSNNTPGLADTDQAGLPQFSQAGGFFSSPFSLTISPPSPSATVRYTLDGSKPDENSPQVGGAIAINDTMIVRAKAFEAGVLDSPVETHSYFFDEGTTLPVVSLATDAGHFFDDEYGIYVIGTNGTSNGCAPYAANFFQDWERPVSLEFFETDGTPGFSFDASIEIQGSCSRIFQIKGLDITLDNKSGQNEFSYDLFPGYGLDEFKSFVLRPSGQDQDKTMFRDGLAHMLIQNQMDLDSQAYRPVVVFINGEYWGIHNIREKLNDDYVDAHHGEEDIDLFRRALNWIGLQEGDATAHLALEDYVRTHNMNNAAYYDYVAARMDINEFINYQITRIYYATYDWPYNNIRVWRPREELGQWRWMAFDVDQDLRHPWRDSIGWAADPNAQYEWSTLFLRKLLQNDGFREEFMQRFASHMNITYEPGRYIAIIDQMQGAIAGEMPRHRQRWTVPTEQTWQTEVQVLRNFANSRPGYVLDDFEDFFNLSGTHQLTVKVSGEGSVRVMGVQAPSPYFQGAFFSGVPLRLEAVPGPGYLFAGWQELGHDDLQTTIPLNSSRTVTAVFVEKDPLPPLIFNEIHYNPSSSQGLDDDYEFLELVNNGPQTADLSGFSMADGVDFTFPNGTQLGPGEYLLLAKNAATYSGLDCPVFQWEDGSLSNGGEALQLVDGWGDAVDFVDYDDGGDWPADPDSEGPSLELIDFSLDNALAASWQASAALGGSPCEPNVTPGNDDFDQATVVGAVPFAASQFVSGATTANDDPQPSCGGNNQGWGSVWYSFTPGSDGLLTAGTLGSSYDTVLSLWQGSRGSLTQVACENDTVGVQSQFVVVPLSGGTVYHLEISSFGGDLGELMLHLDYSSGAQTSQDIVMPAGWNLISGYVVPDDAAVDAVFLPVVDELLLVKNGVGQVYWPGMDIDQIGDWDAREGYQVFMDNGATLTLVGQQVDPALAPIRLLEGWSSISYLLDSAVAVDQALGGIGGDYRLVKNGYGEFYWPEFGIDKIGQMEPGEGYQIFMMEEGVLFYEE